jgi:methyl-branched lipid omega-hydroxylase
VTRPTTGDVDLSDPAFWRDPERDVRLDGLRRRAPVAWQEERDHGWLPAGAGYWAVTGHPEVVRVSRHVDVYVSGLGTEIFDLEPEVRLLYGGMLNMDSPRHTRLRRIVTRAFTPRTVATIEEQIRAEAKHAVAAVADRGGCDVVADLCAPFPVAVICRMMGVDPADDERLAQQTVTALSYGDDETGGFDTSFEAATAIAGYGADLAKRRRDDPRDDLTTAMVQAEVDGERLVDDEIGSFFGLLLTAGIETTGTAAAHGIAALCAHPAQRAAWMSDVDALSATAVEEIVRWSSPVLHFRRTAVVDTVLGDVSIRAGDKVVVWYHAANRDERVFPDPLRFDLRRSPNDHVGFGGGGPHFCLGANLARTELRAFFAELFAQLPDLEVTAPAERMSTPFINGIRSLPCEFTPR